VLRIVGVSAGTSVGLGLLTGLALSFSLDRLIAQWVENGTRNPVAIFGVLLLLLAVSTIACVVPALRALAINPIEALRRE